MCNAPLCQCSMRSAGQVYEVIKQGCIVQYIVECYTGTFGFVVGKEALYLSISLLTVDSDTLLLPLNINGQTQVTESTWMFI